MPLSFIDKNSLILFKIFLTLPYKKADIFVMSNISEIIKIVIKFIGNKSKIVAPLLIGRTIDLTRKYIITKRANIVFVILGM